MQAHYSSVFIIVFAQLITPFYWFLVLPTEKGNPLVRIPLVHFKDS